MRYLFIVQGEGRGHLTQAISLKQMLEHNGHEVVAVMVGKSKKTSTPRFFPGENEYRNYTISKPKFYAYAQRQKAISFSQHFV